MPSSPSSADATQRLKGTQGQEPGARAHAPEGHSSRQEGDECPEGLTITAEQRDALYDQILCRLIAIDEVWFSINEEDYETAQRLGREFSDCLRLILDDLGWGDGTGESVELTMPPKDLRRIFGLLHERAARSLVTEQAQVAEAREEEEGSQLVLRACKRVLTTLDVQVMTT